ncbi:uncharacterized protein LOC114364307 [Ostrinia furnacalis]|uniref:uncharacterized protein LOC114364307 n=1 Tax=Ostrinia furnacalis TaxID=93504 RepID=UPI00103C07CD|nr:uncharacterized protein LOC114364307 [Ostrinia furnacalis]
MKFLVLFALVAVAFAAPQPRKVFHENFEDFIDLIFDEAGHDLDHLMEHYLEFEEFTQTLDYLATNNFKNLIYEMEELPEFKAVLDFLEGHSIDIHYFIDLINEMLETGPPQRKARHTLSGRDFSAFIQDCISEFPKSKLVALFDQKLAEDDDFKAAIEGLQSDEWAQVWSALWENEQFLSEVNTLNANGVDVKVLLDELVAVFGQNYIKAGILSKLVSVQETTTMKFLVLVTLITVALGAPGPQPRKQFHEHYEDFIELIEEESISDLMHIVGHYLEFEEFMNTLDYMQTGSFKELVYEMESLPEFKAVLEYLNSHGIDVYYFIDDLNDMLGITVNVKKTRHSVSGRDFTSFIRDCYAVYPKEKLTALFNQKMAEDEDFRTAVEGLQSEEWNQVYSALWANEQFLAEVQTLADNGIDITVFLEQLSAIFGQN